MATISKQDLNAPRTAADIERKYNFGKSFAEVMGIATDARDTAAEAKKATSDLDVKLTQEEIFNRLTNNGEVQGIFRDDDGQIYINAEYIVALSKLFANDITMTGTFTNTVETYLPPGDEEIDLIHKHALGLVTIPEAAIPLYDFNGDGQITSVDARAARTMQLGTRSMADWSGAKKSTVTMTIDMTNPEKAIHITGKNMWGREVDSYIGANLTNIPNPATEERLEVLERGPVLLYSGDAHLAGGEFITLSQPVSQQKNGIVLVFCLYAGAGEENYAWQSFFVPKDAVTLSAEWNTSGHTFMLSTGGFDLVGTKYLYINDETIYGHETNMSYGDSNSGIFYSNGAFCLSMVYGV